MKIGIVCSIKEKKICCIEGSYYYNRNLQELKNLDIIYILSYCLNRLIAKNTKIDEWKLEDVTELEI